MSIVMDHEWDVAAGSTINLGINFDPSWDTTLMIQDVNTLYPKLFYLGLVFHDLDCGRLRDLGNRQIKCSSGKVKRHSSSFGKSISRLFVRPQEIQETRGKLCTRLT